MALSVQINGVLGTLAPEESLFDLGRRLGVPIPTSCLGNGKCGECMVEVRSGLELLTPAGPKEAHLTGEFRLSCRTTACATSGEVVCATLERGRVQIEKSGVSLLRGTDQFVPDPAVTRVGDQVFLDGTEIARSMDPLYGLAIDLGTTTVVLRLVDLEAGEIVAVQSFENPQRFGGTDVLARVAYDHLDGRQHLRRTLLSHMNKAIQEMPCDPRTIYEVVLAGNSVMRDLFFGLDVFSLGQMPYRSLTEHEFRGGVRATTSLSVTGRKSRLIIHPAGRVYGLPLISGHVGADAAACLLAVDFCNEDRLVALMDIGTNTELVLGHRGRMFVASCPAGPAFEGRGITCGMCGLEGAVERVVLTDDGVPSLRVIADASPRGLCGSGIVDLLSELLRVGRMNALGRFVDDSERFSVTADGRIFISEADISQLAQAKAANATGLQLLFRAYGAAFADVAVFYLAGGFAKHLDISAAKRIGLIPDLPVEQFMQLGNAALEGATIALLSRARRNDLETLVRSAMHVELETFDDFFHYFAEGVQFMPIADGVA